jgi:hypothetical protein
MKTNRWIDGSNRFFNFLLNLYPRDHRDDYAESMRQVFTAQCRETYRDKGFAGILFLWLRVLPDMGYSAIVEHLTSPNASWGLLEPVPNAPLPWKGVFLVLLPGLVYLVSQIAQLTGEPWYMTVYFRAAFFLIIPVLIVWAVTRKFPIWGLIPLGLLFRLVQEIGYQLIILHPDAFSTNPILELILSFARVIDTNLFIPAGIFLVVSVILAIVYFRKYPWTRGIRLWLTAFILTLLARILSDFSSMLDSVPYQLYVNNNEELVNRYFQSNIFERIPMVFNILNSTQMMSLLQNNYSYILYNASAFLMLAMLGTLFIRRHGFFTIFILVGYVLPVMIVGLPVELELNPQLLPIISIVVLLYRSLLSLIAPVWMSRSQTVGQKKKVILICILSALAIHAVMQFFPAMVNMTLTFGYSQWYLSVFLDEMQLVFTFFLGIALYQNTSNSGIAIPAEEDRSFLLGVEKA